MRERRRLRIALRFLIWEVKVVATSGSIGEKLGFGMCMKSSGLNVQMNPYSLV